MAKPKPAAASAPATPVLNMSLLSAIVAATKANSYVFVSDADSAPLVNYNGGGENALIALDPIGARNEEGKIAAKATARGVAMVDGSTGAVPFGGATGPATVPASTPASTSAPKFNIVAVALGEKPKRAGGRTVGESKYDFDKLPAPTPEQAAAKTWPSFFVPATEKQPDPAKSLSSTVNGAQKRLFGKVVGQETVTRAKRGNGRGAKAMLDAAGNKIMETVTVDKYDYSGKLTIFPITDGAPWGFPGQSGAAIARIS
jgi:hypothetical protein